NHGCAASGERSRATIRGSPDWSGLGRGSLGIFTFRVKRRPHETLSRDPAVGFSISVCDWLRAIVGPHRPYLQGRGTRSAEKCAHGPKKSSRFSAVFLDS